MSYIGAVAGTLSAVAAATSPVQVSFVSRLEGTFTRVECNWRLKDVETGRVQEASNVSDPTFVVEESHRHTMTVSKPLFNTVIFKVEPPFVKPYYDVQMRQVTAPIGISQAFRRFLGF
jgi:hypothetical protein